MTDDHREPRDSAHRGFPADGGENGAARSAPDGAVERPAAERPAVERLAADEAMRLPGEGERFPEDDQVAWALVPDAATLERTNGPNRGPVSTRWTGDDAPDDTVLPAFESGAGEESAAPSESRDGRERKNRSSRRIGVLEALALVCVAFAIALLLRGYVAEAYEVKGRSMEPTFLHGQRVVVLKVLYEIERHDIVVFGSTEDPTKNLIKRVIGLEGDRVEIRAGAVYVNGEELEERYIEHPAPLEWHPEITVPAGSFYVLGDNRPDSHDSRVFRAIPEEKLRGKVVFRLWPFGEFDPDAAAD